MLSAKFFISSLGTLTILVDGGGGNEFFFVDMNDVGMHSVKVLVLET